MVWSPQKKSKKEIEGLKVSQAKELTGGTLLALHRLWEENMTSL